MTKETQGAPAAFDFSISNSTAPASITLDTRLGNPAASDFYEISSPGSSLVVSETPVPGYTLSAASQCFNVDSGSPVAVTTNIDVGAGTLTIPNNQLNGQSKIICEVLNSAEEFAVTVDKTWVDGGSETTSISLTATSTETASVTAPTDTVAAVQSTFFTGDVLSLSETDLPNYTEALTCPGGAISGSNPWSIDTAGFGADLTCTLTNTRNSATLNVSKTWQDCASGHSARVQLGTRLDQTANCTGLDETQSLGSATVFGGETLTLTEDDLSADGYAQSLSCTGGITPTLVAGQVSQWTLSMPDSFSGDIDCTLTNDRAVGTLTIQKSITNGTNSTFSFSSNTLSAFNLTTAGGSAEQTFTDLRPGTYDVSEAAQAGWQLTSITCDNGSGTANLTARTLSGITVADREDVTCTFFNRRNTGQFQFEKTWVDAPAGHSATLSADGIEGTDIDWATPNTTGAASESQDSSLFTFNVFGGETVTLSETYNQGGYSNTGFTCDSGISVNADNEFVVPTSPPPLITCSVTNTFNSIPLTLDKTWADAAVGEVTNFSIDGLTSATGSSTADTANETDTDVLLEDVEVGGSYTISEDLLPRYAKTFFCNGATNGTAFTTATQIHFPFTVDTGAAAVECFLTNTRRSATLTVEKVWVGAEIGETANFTVTSSSEAPVTLNHSAAAADQIVTVGTAAIYAGDTITFSETAITGYDTSLSCTQAGTVITGASGSFTLPDSQPSNVTCTWTNTRRSTDVTLEKTWVGAEAGHSATFEVSGGIAIPGSQAFNASASGDFTQTVGSVFKVYAGETITFAETALDSRYSSGTFACDTLTLDGSGTTTIASSPPATATCGITNTAIRPN